MRHVLLTGATGLLGRYLMKDLLSRGVKLAVLVRPSRRNNPYVRVEAAMRVWEDQLQRSLPRPKVLCGDIISSDLGLSGPELSWATENCEAVIHNAASLSFVSTGRHSEPWRSNVGGTENVLEFCQQAGIEKFHHVSTAYVAGKRIGRVYENELNVGQEFANPYEESKVEAEEKVRSSRFLKSLTVLRPAIIVGDSNSGLTFTYHNFYAMLQLGCTLVQSMAQKDFTGKTRGDDFKINVDGHERKNLVPVDWVSEAMARIITTPSLHGQTYHLTPRVPVTVRLIRDVMEEVMETYGLTFSGADGVMGIDQEIEQIFLKHMEVYHSYWKDDPEFDSTNTIKALPDLPCPLVDRKMLTHLARVAIQRGFNWRDPKVEASQFQPELVAN
ncbi:SDR family oxidoreductase [Planctomicrobium piriforme]|uniref:Thioester reductase domain-containing protein n=1 Tax=Planctomicrobium piriforme TaxID=1576369 RepID=A0A1I3G3C3_9PLAN|nr:SDR family oxidoreductase [Planctomicrobium piriforme]SFI17964.1 Thioester reductase domain-containing protein [Planctomicrobium piriforme]